MENITLLMLFITIGFIGVYASVWFLFRFFFQKIESRINEFVRKENDQEQNLRGRERVVIAAAFEGELSANKNKLEAFILIYQEMIRNLREPSRVPKYQQSDQIIHDRPTLTRTIFDTYASRLELLGPDLAGELAHIYAEIKTESTYKTLGNDLNADQLTHVIERIIESAKALIAPIDKIMAGLGVIVRTKHQV